MLSSYSSNVTEQDADFSHAWFDEASEQSSYCKLNIGLSLTIVSNEHPLPPIRLESAQAPHAVLTWMYLGCEFSSCSRATA